MENSIMKTRSAKTKKNFQSDLGESSTSTSLDEKLWGTLQLHIDLAEMVYSKLSFEEFFRLRTVCKAWYVIACKRLGLKEPIHKPFFSLLTKGGDGQLDGILIYNALSRSWDWRPQWTHTRSYDAVASQGVVFSADDKLPAVFAGAFYWESKVYNHRLLPPRPNSFEKMILGISVSVTQGPFGSFSAFRVVRGGRDSDTQVFESGVWQTKPCRLPKSEGGGLLRASTGCAECNGRVYITTEHSREIFVYDFGKARWSSLFSPGDWVFEMLPQHYCLDTLGAWDSRVFDVTSDFQSGRSRSRHWSLQVWELVDETLHKWKVYDCMPERLCFWLRSTRGFPCASLTKTGDISMQASFSGDFLLVYSWDFSNGLAGRFCLFNMATKNWEKLNIAAGAVAIGEEVSSDPDDSEDSEDYFDLLANEYESSLEGDDDDMDSDFDEDVFSFLVDYVLMTVSVSGEELRAASSCSHGVAM